MDRGYRAIRFDELEDVPWKEGLTLRPVRSQLGVKAFGAAGFVGRELGDLVVDPHVHREAVATEPDTAVLAFGGPPRFQPAGHEYMARVRGAIDRPEDALAIAEAGLDELGETPGTLYAMALALAATGDRQAARRRLDEAIAREPDLRREAESDAPLLS